MPDVPKRVDLRLKVEGRDRRARGVGVLSLRPAGAGRATRDAGVKLTQPVAAVTRVRSLPPQPKGPHIMDFLGTHNAHAFCVCGWKEVGE
jgi:hypothetical protein